MTNQNNKPIIKNKKEEEMFDKARDLLNPISQFFASTYSERKFVVFMLLYATAIAVVFGHYALTTGNKDWDMFTKSDPHWWFISRFPMIESGGVNACLMMYVILPLTMAKFTWSVLGDTIVGKFIPTRRLIRVHTVVAWTLMVFFTILLAAFLPMIFQMRAIRGYIPEQLSFTNQMFITGYMIYSCMLAIWITSALRNRIRYEIFYYVHQLTLVLFILLVFHTLGKYRTELNQCYPWVTPPFLYYISDRLYMRIFRHFRTPLVSATTIDAAASSENKRSGKAIILRIRRPALYTFKPGQYAYLRFDKIDKRNWHPFSIMSDPDSPVLEFFVGVTGAEDSWTSKLYDALGSFENKDGNESEQENVEFEVMGPYGNSLGNAEDFSHVLAMGSGTGFVPVLSLLKNHMGRLVRLDPEAHCQRLHDNFDRVAEQQIASEEYKGSLGSKTLHVTGLRRRKKKNQQKNVSAHMQIALETDIEEEEKSKSRLMKMHLLAVHATRTFYAKVLMTLLPMFGVALIGVTISWNTIPDPDTRVPWNLNHMRMSAMALSALFQFLYAVVALCFWNADSLATFIDMILIVVCPFADWLWFLRIIQDGHLKATDLLLFTILMTYFVFRFWWSIVKPTSSVSWRSVTQIPGISTLERLDAVWIVREAQMVSQLLPDINEKYEKLIAAWGEERASKVCRIQIFVTDKNQHNLDALKRDVYETAVYRAGCIRFGRRPNLVKLVEDHTLELVSNHQNTYSMLSYCGSVGMSSELQRIKVNMDLLKAITGNGTHQMEFQSECHGGAQRKKKNSDQPAAVSSSSPAAVSPAPNGDEEGVVVCDVDKDTEFVVEDVNNFYSSKNTSVTRSTILFTMGTTRGKTTTKVMCKHFCNSPYDSFYDGNNKRQDDDQSDV